MPKSKKHPLKSVKSIFFLRKANEEAYWVRQRQHNNNSDSCKTLYGMINPLNQGLQRTTRFLNSLKR